jgi:protein TonB
MARRRRSSTSTIYATSLLLHAGVAMAVVNIDEQKLHEATAVTMTEVKKPKEPQKADEPPPPPRVEAPKPVRKVPKAPAPPPPVAAAPAPAEAAPAPAAPVADFGLSMSGGVGAGGIAVPLGNSTRTPQVKPTRTAPPKALTPAKNKPEQTDDACIEAMVKPKPISTPQPAYADRAREAGIQGKVRVELTVDESGAVVNARVLESLGYGLDEAALEAAKTWRFEPATRCGKATATTFVVGIRFTI